MRRRTFTPLVTALEPRLSLSGLEIDPEVRDPANPLGDPDPPPPIVQPIPPGDFPPPAPGQT